MNRPEFMNWAQDQIAVESEHKPIAVIVKGNPKYLDDPKIRPMAEAFYAKVQALLEPRYDVRFDAGRPFTHPDLKAALWVGHSRGIDRLQYAIKGIKTIALQTQDHDQFYENDDARGRDPKHYELSEHDIQVLQSA